MTNWYQRSIKEYYSALKEETKHPEDTNEVIEEFNSTKGKALTLFYNLCDVPLLADDFPRLVRESSQTYEMKP